MNLEGKRLVVTGGAGFIGSHVVDRLVAVGADVLAVDDLSKGRRENLTGALEQSASLSVGDVRDEAFMRRALEGCDVVVHMACDNLRASLRAPMRTQDINAAGTLVTALAAVDRNVDRFIYVSSSEAYGSSNRDAPMSEHHPLLPTTVYGASKAAGELYAQSCARTYGLPVTVIRPFNGYGPREHSAGNSAEVIPKFSARITAGLPPVIFGDGTQTRDFTWVQETAIGIVAATASDELVGDAVNIACGTPVSIAEVAALLLKLLDGNGLEPVFTEARPGDVTHHWADVEKARRLLGFEASTSLEEGLKRYIDWLQHGGNEVERSEPEVVCNW